MSIASVPAKTNPGKRELTPFQHKLSSMKDFLGKQVPQLKMVMQKYMDPDEVVRFALNACYRNPKLFECDQGSVLQALMKAGQMGVKPDGWHGHLIPYWNGKTGCNECQFQPDYKGFVALAYRNSQVKSISAEAVREGDFFEYEQGTNGLLRFRKSLGQRGELYAAWAMAELSDGGYAFVVMGPEEIAAVRAVSQSASRDDSIWNKWPDAMWAKSAIKQLVKRIPLGEDLVRAVQMDDADESGKTTIDLKQGIDFSLVPEPEDLSGTGETTQGVSVSDLTNPQSATPNKTRDVRRQDVKQADVHEQKESSGSSQQGHQVEEQASTYSKLAKLVATCDPSNEFSVFDLQDQISKAAESGEISESQKQELLLKTKPVPKSKPTKKKDLLGNPEEGPYQQ